MGSLNLRLIKDEKGQVLIIFSLLIATVIASLSILHAQNLLAGVESSRALMVFPKEDIRNLKQIAKNELPDYIVFEDDLNKQIEMIYALRGAYGSVKKVYEEYNYYKIRVLFSNSEVEYVDTFIVRK
ncbi:hypothetical protein DRO97_03895 [Archaeoglobales archaeon]|nr:MAG: hypothetical protein DRO97_03895 [Archaeoglobales archaeon]